MKVIWAKAKCKGSVLLILFTIEGVEIAYWGKSKFSMVYPVVFMYRHH
jgi:hypothetical protein